MDAKQITLIETEPDRSVAAESETRFGVNIGTLVEQTIDKGLPVETLDKLLDLRERLKAEWAREQYYVALSRFQGSCPPIPKRKAVTGKNGAVRFHYAPLDDIVELVKEPLSECGFSWSLVPEQDESNVIAVLKIHHAAGHEETTRFSVPIDTNEYMTAIQRVASARSYALRYAFCDGFGIMTSDEDTDGAGEATFTLEEYAAAGAELQQMQQAKAMEDLSRITKELLDDIPQGDERRDIMKRVYGALRADIVVRERVEREAAELSQ